MLKRMLKALGLTRRELTAEEMQARVEARRILEDKQTFRAAAKGGGSIDPREGRDRY